MSKKINELLEGVFVNNKITSKELKLLLIQADEMSVDKSALLMCIKEKYIDIIVNIYREYEKMLKRANSMDFDDLLLNVLKLFKNICTATKQRLR